MRSKLLTSFSRSHGEVGARARRRSLLQLGGSCLTLEGGSSDDGGVFSSQGDTFVEELEISSAVASDFNYDGMLDVYVCSSSLQSKRLCADQDLLHVLYMCLLNILFLGPSLTCSLTLPVQLW